MCFSDSCVLVDLDCAGMILPDFRIAWACFFLHWLCSDFLVYLVWACLQMRGSCSWENGVSSFVDWLFYSSHYFWSVLTAIIQHLHISLPRKVELNWYAFNQRLTWGFLDSLWYFSFAIRSASDIWRYRLWACRACSHCCRLLEISAYACSFQFDHSKCRPSPFYRFW